MKQGKARGVVMMLGLFFGVTAMSWGMDPELTRSIQSGKQLFTHETFGGNGAVCETCHLNGGVGAGKRPDGKPIPSLTNAAAIFPRYKAKVGKVWTLQDQVRGCAGMALQGTPPEYGSTELNDLVAYVTSLAQGKPIDMGGKPQ
ncbi:MAG: cytochrome C [Betaproteobacteria bacterium]|nr:cytochrome C [Betaproteobacteria bacterium]